MLFCTLAIFASCTKDDPITTNGITEGGAVYSAFSVSPSHQVRFSKGNLQYQATTDTWRFAENQYDRIGYDNENISQYYAGWIDLFGWATSGYDCGNTYYMPYDHEYLGDYELGCGYGPLPSREYDLVGPYAECDWGVHNAISNGGNKAGLWRTLSADEWKYLINSRPNSQNLYGAASIEGSNGLVLLPDDWSLPEGATFNPGMGTHEDKEYYARQNSYSKEQWLILQSSGAVFLPAGGSREEEAFIDYVNDIGRYWTVTRCFDQQLYAEWCAYTLYFQSNDVIPAEYNNPRDYGRSVRLVQDI